MNKLLIALALSALGVPVLADTTTSGAIAINLTQDCGGGGTRTAVGTYDETTGALTLTVTLTGCVGHPGESFNDDRNGDGDDQAHKSHHRPAPPAVSGTDSISGTFLAGSAGMFTVNLTDQVNTTLTFADGGKLTRACNIVRVGSFDSHSNEFNGSDTRNNCTLNGSFHEDFGLVEHILREADSDEGME